MVTPENLQNCDTEEKSGYRLINSKYPPIPLFDDVASEEEFQEVFELQALTNPRIRNQLGNLNLLPRQEIPYGIDGLSYAVGPFVHINPDGSRFSAGDYGVLYIADTAETAISEVRYHQQTYWSKVEGLDFERFVFRELHCQFVTQNFKTLHQGEDTADILDLYDYSASQALGSRLWAAKIAGLQYPSVRNSGAECYALFSPASVRRVVQAQHYEMIYQNGITSVNKVC